jgi:hypothetical protein
VEQLRAGGQLIEVLPYSPFARAAAGLGHVDLELDTDGVARSVYMRSGIGQAWWPHITQTLLVQEGILSEQVFPADKGEEFSGLANVRRYHRYIPFVSGPNSYPQVSAVELLENLIKMIREKEQGARQLKAMTGETRMTAYVLAGLPVCMVGYFMVANPNYLMTLWNDETGRYMLFGALAMELTGSFVMWRMLRSI